MYVELHPIKLCGRRYGGGISPGINGREFLGGRLYYDGGRRGVALLRSQGDF